MSVTDTDRETDFADIERRLRAACAATIPQLLEDGQPDVTSHRPEVGRDALPIGVLDVHHARRSTRSIAVAAVGVAATVVLLTVLAIARYDRGQPGTASTPPAWRPDGIEKPIVDLGPATQVWDGPVVAAMTRKIGVDGHPPQILTTSLTYYQGESTAAVQICTWENGGGGCRPEWNPATWSISRTSSVDNGDATFDLWTLEGLPDNAAYVTFTQGENTYWQRPIAGFVAFPYEDGSPMPIVVAYDESGVDLGRYDDATQMAQPAAEFPARVDITQDEYEELYDLTRQSMRTCLTERGGTIGAGDVATFTDGSDLTAWNDCVSIVKQAVASRFSELTSTA